MPNIVPVGTPVIPDELADACVTEEQAQSIVPLVPAVCASASVTAAPAAAVRT